MGYMAAHRWEYRYAPTQPTIGGGCEMPWVATNWGVMSLHAEQNVPGDFQIRLTVSYTSYMLPPGPPIPNTVKTKTVSIAPPNRVEIIDGMDEPALFADPVIVEFQIYSGSQPIGPYAYGFVQERITNQWCLVPPLPAPEYPPNWDNWLPGSPIPSFYRYGSILYDLKTNGTTWAGLLPQVPVGNDYFIYTQNLRYCWTTPCGEDKTWSLGSVRLARYTFDDDYDNKWAYREIN